MCRMESEQSSFTKSIPRAHAAAIKCPKQAISRIPSGQNWDSSSSIQRFHHVQGRPRTISIRGRRPPRHVTANTRKRHPYNKSRRTSTGRRRRGRARTWGPSTRPAAACRRPPRNRPRHLHPASSRPGALPPLPPLRLALAGMPPAAPRRLGREASREAEMGLWEE